MKKVIVYILSFLLLFGYAFAADEDLDEVVARKTRLATAVWGKDYQENASDIWQPETLCYYDESYTPYGSAQGSEVWRMTSTNGLRNFVSDINYSQISANGKRMAFRTHRATDASACSWITNETYGGHWTQRTDGTYLRLLDESPSISTAHNEFLAWNPSEPDTFYKHGHTYCSEGTSNTTLYKVTVGDSSGSAEAYITGYQAGYDLYEKKAITGDGKKILTGKWLNYPYAIPSTLLPSGSKGIDEDGWSVAGADRDYTYWGNPTSYDNTATHDSYVSGSDSDYWWLVVLNPTGQTGIIWRMRFQGSDADGGPSYTDDHIAPYDWWPNEELQPANTRTQGNDEPDPWCDDGDAGTDCADYMSHVAMDRWGRYAIFNHAAVTKLGIYDIDNRVFEVSGFTDGATGKTVQHVNWDSFSDYPVADSADATQDDRTVFRQKYDDGDSQVVLADIHTSESGDYERLGRPQQSPDGTKLYFNSSFLYLDEANDYDIFYVVSYYPYPPEVKTVEANAGTVTVTVWWNLGITPRGYSSRGWPDEDTDDPAPPREIKEFVLWRSTDKSTWAVVDTSDYTAFDSGGGQNTYDFSNGTWGGDTSEGEWTLTDTPGDGAYYYAVTSREWSGLESHTLSNIFSITVSSGSGSGSEDTGYPASPGGDSNFYSTSPDIPQSLSASHNGSGRYTISWSEPTSHSYVRYYNIYALDSSEPTAIQQRRIASIPATEDEADGTNDGAFTFIDSFGESSGLTYYGITSVDYQGNESTILTSGGQSVVVTVGIGVSGQ